MGWTIRGSRDMGVSQMDSGKGRRIFGACRVSKEEDRVSTSSELKLDSDEDLAERLNAGPTMYSCGSGHVTPPCRASASSSAKGLLVPLLQLGERRHGRWQSCARISVSQLVRLTCTDLRFNPKTLVSLSAV